MTAFTDSEEEEPSDTERGDGEPPADELCLLLERIDRLHQGSDPDKRQSLRVLLEQREEVCHFCSVGGCQSCWKSKL